MSKQPLHIIKPDWPAPDNIEAVSTTRMGGFSLAPYDGLNLACHVGDDKQSVESNRALLRQQLNLSSEPCWLNQTHSTDVTILGDSGAFDLNSDAAISRESGRVAAVMTADCLPILLCNREGTEVAAIHAGWRGLVDGIIEKTLLKMDSSPAELLAWIGPAISQSRFEVGEEVRNLFVGKNKQAAEYFRTNRPGHWLCDLPGLAKGQLQQLGTLDTYLSGLCSFNDTSRFYSYRRNNITGRMACLIWIKSCA